MRDDDEHATNGRDASGRYVAGHVSTGGRPRGARSKLNELFCADLLAVWEARGRQGLEQLAEESPASLARIVVRLLPAEIKLEHASPLADIPEHALLDLLNVLELARRNPEGLVRALADARDMPSAPPLIEHERPSVALGWTREEMEAEIAARGRPGYRNGPVSS